MRDSMGKKGFFFTVMALAILSFMLLTVQVWVRTFEQSDISAASRFKGESMRLVLATVSDKTFSDFANASAFYAVSKLDNYTSVDGQGLCNSAKSGCPALDSDPVNNPGAGMVNKTVYELMVSGTSMPITGNPISYDSNEMNSYTLDSWEQKIKRAAALMGFNATFSPAYNFSLSQPDAWSVNSYFEVQMNLTDFEGTMSQSRTLKANATFSVNGFLDPMVTRDDMKWRGKLRDSSEEKQIWKDIKYDYSMDAAPVAPPNGADAESGNGWFAGPAITILPNDSSIINNLSEQQRLKDFIYVGPFDQDIVLFAPLPITEPSTGTSRQPRTF